jgi:hypothetical protein
MFGALAGSFWWVMLTYTIFQFLVFEISSDRARRMVCPWLQRSRTVPTHAQDCQKLTSFSISLATVAHRLSHRELGHPDTPRDHRYKRVRAFPADAFLSRDATDDTSVTTHQQPQHWALNSLRRERSDTTASSLRSGTGGSSTGPCVSISSSALL